MANQTGRNSDKLLLRLPDGMRDRIAEAAQANGRSMNAEVVARLEKSFEDDAYITDLEAQVEDHGTELKELRQAIEELQVSVTHLYRR